MHYAIRFSTAVAQIERGVYFANGHGILHTTIQNLFEGKRRLEMINEHLEVNWEENIVEIRKELKSTSNNFINKCSCKSCGISGRGCTHCAKSCKPCTFKCKCRGTCENPHNRPNGGKCSRCEALHHSDIGETEDRLSDLDDECSDTESEPDTADIQDFNLYFHEERFLEMPEL